jgi:hypothetical protein
MLGTRVVQNLVYWNIFPNDASQKIVNTKSVPVGEATGFSENYTTACFP